MISNEGREFCRGIGLLAEHIICMADSYEEPIEKFKKSPFYSPEFEDKGRIIQDKEEGIETIYIILDNFVELNSLAMKTLRLRNRDIVELCIDEEIFALIVK